MPAKQFVRTTPAEETEAERPMRPPRPAISNAMPSVGVGPQASVTIVDGKVETVDHPFALRRKEAPSQWFNVRIAQMPNDEVRFMEVVGLNPRDVYLGQTLEAANEKWRIDKLEIVSDGVQVTLRKAKLDQ